MKLFTHSLEQPGISRMPVHLELVDLELRVCVGDLLLQSFSFRSAMGTSVGPEEVQIHLRLRL
jgi:hypothetical protein